MALTAGLDSLPTAPPSRAKTLAEILMVYPQQGKAILQHANQRRVQLSQSTVVIKKVTDSLQNMHDLAAPVVDTPSTQSVDQLLSSVVDFAAIIDIETPVLQDSNESWPKIADDVRSKVNAAMRTLTHHALSCFGNWVLQLKADASEWATAWEGLGVGFLTKMAALKLEERALLEVKASDFTEPLEQCVKVFEDRDTILKYLKEPSTDAEGAEQDEFALSLLPIMRIKENTHLKDAMGSLWDRLVSHLDSELFEHLQESV